MPKRKTREEKKTETREAVVAAAARLFAERGFHATSVEAITEEAGFSRGAFYSNFERKEDLLLVLLEDHVVPTGQVIDRLDERIGEVMSRAGRASAISHSELVGPGRGWSLLFLELWVCAARDESVRARLHQTLERIKEATTAELTETFRRRGVEPRFTPSELASALLVIEYGWIFSDLADPDGASDRAVLAEVLAEVRRGWPIEHGREIQAVAQ